MRESEDSGGASHLERSAGEVAKVDESKWRQKGIMKGVVQAHKTRATRRRRSLAASCMIDANGGGTPC